MHLYCHATKFRLFLVSLVFSASRTLIKVKKMLLRNKPSFSMVEKQRVIIYQRQTTDKIISNKYTRKYNTCNVHSYYMQNAI